MSKYNKKGIGNTSFLMSKTNKARRIGTLMISFLLVQSGIGEVLGQDVVVKDPPYGDVFLQDPNKWPVHHFAKDTGTHVLNPNNWEDFFYNP